MLIPMRELNSKNPDIDGKMSSIFYLDDETVAIRFKHLDNIAKKRLIKKYEYAKEMSEIKGLYTPIDILETEKGFCGYIENRVQDLGKSYVMPFGDYINQNVDKITLEDITEYFLECSRIISSSHAEGIVMPDVTSLNNVYYNFHTKEASFIDYHGMQVRDMEALGFSDFIAIDPVLSTDKYGTGNMWSPNVDYYSLAIRYYYFATYVNIPLMLKRGFHLEELLQITESEKTPIADVIRDLYNLQKENYDISDVLREMNDNYVLSRHISHNPNRFIKK